MVVFVLPLDQLVKKAPAPVNETVPFSHTFEMKVVWLFIVAVGVLFTVTLAIAVSEQLF